MLELEGQYSTILIKKKPIKKYFVLCFPDHAQPSPGHLPGIFVATFPLIYYVAAVVVMDMENYQWDGCS